MTTSISPKLVSTLNLARALAATYVVAHHLANHHGWSSQGLGIFFRFGQEAVLVFFLLSGFVIFSNERDRVFPPHRYYLRRIRRLYPTLVAAMVVSTAVAADNGTLAREFHVSELVGTLLGLQDISDLKPGVIVDPYLGNDPLWSLSYEAAFYFVFPFVMWLWKRSSNRVEHGIGIASCAAYVIYVSAPNHWALVSSYFLVWWCGATIADRYHRGERSYRSLGPPLYWLVALCSIAGISAVWIGFRSLGTYPVLPFRHFAVGLLLVVTIFSGLGARLAKLLVPIAVFASSLASISYGLYVLHYPILVTWQRAQTPGGFAIATFILVASAYLSDAKMLQLFSRARKPVPTQIHPSRSPT
ncbi:MULTISPECIES: acyltransferase [unclassified Bradyrhizobium]|uniref:acyltransferase family protein n=1 Tax=unclassified Bradyrhizobium TaxID=2631580 RepID=UPI001FF8F766|nr:MULTISPECIES: acyltransferase [unclassified Bradyrhizobium]MCK1345788.1 acyltransferase [Bradyrhizobium sp. CW11]MCK1587112.1 acyltransferase [Bradyrhizobium sp. 169]